MAQLRTLASDGAGSAIELRPGTNRFGRTDDNDFQILDPAVSAHHCVIEYNDGVAVVRDLGSTNGTFVNGMRIQEAVLQHGQVLRIGTVELLYEESAPGQRQAHPGLGTARSTQPIRIAPPLQPATATISSHQTDHVRSCIRHIGTPAKWVCVKCHKPFCGNCVRTTRIGMHEFRSCPDCNVSCIPEHEFRRQAEMAQTDFFALLPGAFSFPFAKGGVAILVAGTIFLGVFEVGRMVLKHFGITFVHLWLAYWLSVIMIVGFVFAYMQNVVLASAQGEDRMPDLPELSSFWGDIFVPFFRLVLIWVACLAPGFVVQFAISPLASVPVYLLGLACVPMAVLTVSLADSIRGLNPLIIFSGIAKVPVPYLVTCLVFGAALGIRIMSELLLQYLPIPVLPVVVGTFVGLYGLSVGARLLGLIYYLNKDKLAWF
ncbi:MAG: FHA domain-containing protein [Verrucomicrobiae bacterium]|nr:FHA domain-containing protein [Verrucomicrobiae bacterium]MDW7980592.1 FHA domain-containing protein [Verrucomicrobiales bacterium]